jgi:hypothetical protein
LHNPQEEVIDTQQAVEVMWVHTIGIDSHELYHKLKTNNTSLFCERDGSVMITRYVEHLPFVPNRQSESQFHMVVSDLAFELETKEAVKSASMSSILKTLQSLFFLGKQIQYLKLGERNNSSTDARPQLNVSYSWAKAFKLIKEHRILSLAAFQPPLSLFCDVSLHNQTGLSKVVPQPSKPRQFRP